MAKLLNILMIISVFTVFSQEATIKGTVKNIDNKPLANILVQVLSSEKNTLTYKYTDNMGKFIFKISQPQTPLYLKITSIFYEDQEIEVSSLTNLKEIVFTLENKVQNLNEVVVRSTNYNKDTVNLDINKYNIIETESVESTLKKIPGISIDKSGRIKYFNKEIEKILIDGDDLANDQYTFISKNLRSEVLDDIQVLKNFEENTVYKKTRESDKIALNLKIKDKFKNIWFGNISLGYGNGIKTKPKYQESFNLGLLKKRIKFLDFFKYSTLGNHSGPTTFGESDNKLSNKPFYNIKKYDVGLPEEITNFNKSIGNTFLFNTKIGKTVLRSTNFVGLDNEKQDYFRKMEYFLDNEDIFLEENTYKDKKLTILGELEFKNPTLKKGYFINQLKYSIQSNRFNSSTLINQSETSDTSKNKNFSLQNYLQYTHDFTRRTILDTEINIGLSNLNENTTVNSTYLSSVVESNFLVYQNVDKKLKYLDIKTSLSHLIAKGFKGQLLINNNFAKDDYNIMINPASSTYTNLVVFNNNQFLVKPSLIYKISRRIKLQTSISNNYFKLNKLQKKLLNYNVKLNLRYWSDIELYFAKKQEFPLKQNYLKNYFLINNNTFKKGNFFIDPMDYNLFSVKISNKNRNNTLDNEVFFSYKTTNSSLLQKYSFSNNINYQEIEVINNKGEEFFLKNQLIFLVGAIGFNIKSAQSYLKLPLNSTDNELSRLYSGNYKFEITSYFSSKFNFNLLFEYGNYRQKYRNENSSFDSKNLATELEWNPTKEITTNLKGGIYELDKNYYQIFNTSINYTPKDKNISYGLRLNNLLNEDEFSIRERNSFFLSKTTVPLVPFYAFASVKYIF